MEDITIDAKSLTLIQEAEVINIVNNKDYVDPIVRSFCKSQSLCSFRLLSGARSISLSF